ncbi:MAG: bifunctional riboflavin kinase/FAD synthetase [Gammaproteobacteria bacterium]|nr:bifunctional riboflavin kinase/FAD synthetase [Gammaproteobacteria bacterium]
MHLIRGLHNLKKLSGCVLTIGNFDGVHSGHQEIIRRLTVKAKELGVPSVVISFSVTPQTFFGRPRARLSNFRDKHILLESLGVDKHLLIRFNKTFSETSANSFIEEIIMDQLNARYCLIGDDFRFGKGRLGDFCLLEKYAKLGGFSADKLGDIQIKGQRVSSSAIRNYLSLGEFDKAEQLLGRPYSISGLIAHGAKKGRTIGFPTINIGIRRNLSPVLGVFAVLAEINGITHYGVCNVGKRPTVGGEKTLLEVFIFDFDEEVYGEHATVIFKFRVREEKKFNSFDELKSQISEDVKSAKSFFKI